MIKGYKHTEEAKEKNRLAHLGKKNSPETRAKISLANKGVKKPPRSLEWRKKQRMGKIGKPLMHRRGENHHWWKGGLTTINNKIRHSLEYKLWRTSVFVRDNRTCIWCGSKEDIQADHIKPFAYFPELRFAIDNGRTLCKSCHKTTETFGKNTL